jgi:hypothetical protein
VGVVRHECPRQAGRTAFRKEFGQARNQILAIPVIAENITPFDSANHHVLQSPWRI